MNAEELLRERRLDEALVALQQEIRADPSNPKLRVFLFQLLCVLGQWERALTQLNVVGELNSECMLMAQVCQPALHAERLREKVFAGERSPLIFGEPEEWVGWLVQAAALQAADQRREAESLRGQALEAAPAIAGTIDGAAFEWIMDADARLGPLVEAVVEGRYYWIPFSRIHRIQLEPPSDLRDLVWIPVRFTWTHGGHAVGLLPVRYPGSESHEDAAIRMASKTGWSDHGSSPEGLGQRLWSTEQDDYPILKTREIVLENAEFDETSQRAEAHDTVSAVSRLLHGEKGAGDG